MKTEEEIQLSADLRTIVADQPFAPDIAAIERSGRRRVRRGFALRGLAGLGVVSVAVAGGLVAAGHGSGTAATGGTGAAGQPTTSSTGTAKSGTPKTVAPKLETVAYVRQQIEAALNPSNYLIEAKQTPSDGTTGLITIWTDPRTGNTMLLQGSGASSVAYWEHDFFLNRVLHWYQTQVNYGPHTYWIYDMHAAGPIQGPVPKGPVGGNVFLPAEVKQILDGGKAKIVGHPIVDGRRTVELSVPFGNTTRKWYEIYADAKTFQVVRMVKYFPESPSAHFPPIQDDYTWVPRSAATVKLVNHPVIPAGYTQVPVGS
jgi:hypothetical protein